MSSGKNLGPKFGRQMSPFFEPVNYLKMNNNIPGCNVYEPKVFVVGVKF